MALRGSLLFASGIILCNQDLLTAHLKKLNAGQKPLINERATIMVIDEAHNLEDKVRSSYTTRYNKNALVRSANKIRAFSYSAGPEFAGGLDNFFNVINKLFYLLTSDVSAQINDAPTERKYADRFYFRNTPAIDSALQKASALSAKIVDMADVAFGMSGRNGRASKDALESALDDFHDVTWFLSSLTDNRSETLFWLERSYGEIEIVACPKRIAPLVKSLYFRYNYTTILTSATITNTSEGDLDNQYGYFIKNTGFPPEGENGFLADPQPSPFPYDEHAMLYYCGDLPNPRDDRDGFVREGTARVKELLQISKGRALVLFTAKTDMESVYKQLTDENLPYKILMQTASSSQEQILNEFRTNESSVLLGTGAYWEGINIKGSSLSNLIIFRLPFPVPDPVVDYKYSQAQNGLMEVSVPEMVIKCKQGIGRLIRSDEDKGIAAIIDPRLGDGSSAPYKHVLWDALPIKNKTSSIETLKEFYAHLFN